MSGYDELPKHYPVWATDREVMANLARAAAGDASALRDAFQWDATPEGGAYWVHAHQALKTEGQLPAAAHARLKAMAAEIRTAAAIAHRGRRAVIHERRNPTRFATNAA